MPTSSESANSRALVPTKRGNQASDWERIRALALDGLSSAHSRRAYGNALDDFQEWCGANAPDGFNKATVQRYRAALEERGLAPSSINVRLSAIRKLAAEAADNGELAPEIAAAIGRVKGAKRHGTRTGNWLSRPRPNRCWRFPIARRTRENGTGRCFAC